jgi:ATP-dependent DNA helicase RecG
LSEFSDTPIEYLKGVGPERAELFRKELKVFTFGDLLEHYPFRYVDRSRFNTISEITDDAHYMQFKGRLSDIEEAGDKRTRRLRAMLTDGTGQLELVWFKGLKWVKPSLRAGEVYVVYGKPTRYQNRWNLAHPELEHITSADQLKNRGMEPVYSSTEKLAQKGLHSKGIWKVIRNLLPQLSGRISENMPIQVLDELRLPTKEQALVHLHNPPDIEHAVRAQNRIKFEELFFLQLQLLATKQYNKRNFKGHVFSHVGDYFNTFYHQHLPFELTNAQKRVVKEVRKDMGTGIQMNRLLQGDVGSGKTMVAILCMLLALDNGFQAALMAPTEILASQHFVSVSETLRPLGIHVSLLTGSTRQTERDHIHARLLDGSLHVLIGTHALLEDPVVFKNLGLAVIDEQHRFGVAQRARLWKKNTIPPHVLVMTATPIPRTLAMTLYGDLDVSVIDELPPGRKPITTRLLYEKQRLAMLDFLEKEIALGRQVYVVYPLIEESEKLDMASLTDGYEAMVRRFPPPAYRVSIVHGKMRPADKDLEMQQFYECKTHIMVATTVIEVGVNVPNASVMVIENAERFGLSQLHQLRGRVGRGADQSYCLLMAGLKVSTEGKERLKVMCETNDGFKIAEEDLKLRGPGDIMGTRQSGDIELKLANLATDGNMLNIARKHANALLAGDPDLSQPANRKTAEKLKRLLGRKVGWSRIS